MRSESRRAASAAFGCEETAFEGFGANLKSFRARFRSFWLPGLGAESSFQMPGAREGRHRSRLRPSEALDPQGTPGPLSRVRERVGVRASSTIPGNTRCQKTNPHYSSRDYAVSGSADGNRCAYGLGREGLYTARSRRGLSRLG